ncbi:5-guanidino-2-oxopentanoate decarboxylase [Paracoccus aminophilus]|uniref:Acetolactate synthase I/II/III large subunit n=1 Tax=Paracoccus aminophilus JCM 7686 TaxID=1367847 RepID=S5YE66_PARAH|nr:5-guanidino-2-oxopentanoate decarboxylase [Paracoccus aminophilus]AGT09778.1 acetolactate synthase I/II/III large subunit [Paracoccus aminophilus JCM 7686]
MKTVAKYLLESLAAYGTDTVFGIPGVHTVELYRSLPNSGIRHVTPRHEQGAGFMADGYARASGRVGVCFTITGPGLTNIATAMAQAYADSIPMLVISSVNSRGRMNSGEGWLHELPNQQAFAREVAAFSQTVLTPEDLPRALSRAFALFRSARPRPVHIEIPMDVMGLDASHLPRLNPEALPLAPMAAPASLKRATELLDAAKTPLILAGGGAIDAADELRALAEKLSAPVVMTVNGRGLLPLGHPLAINASASTAAVREVMARADCILAVGTECGPTDYDMYVTGYPKLAAKLIRLDIDPEQTMRGFAPDLVLVGGAKASLAGLVDLVATAPARDHSDLATVSAKARAELSEVLQVGAKLVDFIRDTLPEVPIVGDSTQPVYGAQLDYAAPAPRHFFCSASGFGTLGYGLPAASGAALAVKGPVISLIGDGGIQFTIGELAAARELDLPVIVLLWNNSGYREIKTAMIDMDVQPEGVDIWTPDFQLLAQGFGCVVEKPEALAALPDLLHAAARRAGPTVIELDEAMLLRDLG